MKRYGNLYEKIYDIENVKRAIKNSTKGKRDKKYIRKIYDNFDFYADEISRMLKEKTYKLGENKQHIIYDESSNKERLITVPKFYPDQIIHWALSQVIQPIINRSMYRYCCGSVPGRGGIDVKNKIDDILKHDKKAKYVMKLDIRKFFPSIRHDKLKELLRKKFKDEDALDLAFEIIDKGCPEGVGLPIGYYTSQLFSNFYLQEIDHFIKQELKIRHYIRYVDDIAMFDTNKRKLRRALPRLREKLESNGFGLSIKDNWQIWRIGERPIDFVGYRFHGGYTKLRKKIFYRLTRTVRRIKEKGLNICRARKFNSYIGWAEHINFRNYYINYIKPVISKGAVRRYIGRFDRIKSKTAVII